jgi:hypothetical protein
VLLKDRENELIDQRPEPVAVPASAYFSNTLPVRLEHVILWQLVSESWFAKNIAEVRFSWMIRNQREKTNFSASTAGEMR